MRLRGFLTDERGGAAEFALILPVFLVLFFGIIDGGRYLWEINRAEKATQAGARAAAVTGMIPAGLIDYSFSINNGIEQGSAVPVADFPGVTCVGSAGAPECTWNAAPSEAIDLSPSADSFAVVVDRMQAFMPELQPENVSITYANSGLGFAGDPSGPDVAPIIIVSLVDAKFQPILTSVFGLEWDIPSSPYSISQEDGRGTCFEETC